MSDCDTKSTIRVRKQASTVNNEELTKIEQELEELCEQEEELERELFESIQLLEHRREARCNENLTPDDLFSFFTS